MKFLLISDRRDMRILKYFFIFFIASALIVYLWQKRTPYQIITGQTMGTYYSIKIRTEQENKKLYKKIQNELSEINLEMSVFDLNSEISSINGEPEDTWIPLSEPMQNVLKTAHKIYKQSNGAFDPTVGKLIDLWGFGTSRQKKIPTDEEIKNLLEISGFDKVTFNNDYSELKKSNSEVMINLSAIAKGYGVDRIAELLKENGYNDFVIEIGGEVRTSGQKSEDVDGWNIGIIKPANNYTENAYIVTLKDLSVATSGDYRNFFYIDNEKFSHTISPQTGYPVKSNLMSVTVFDKSCMTADGLATAMMVMGETKALNFANRNNIAAIFFIRDEDGNPVSVLSKKAKSLLEQK